MTWLPLCLMLAVACLYYVFYLPGRLFLGPEKTRAGYLRERKDAVYENLRDLNFEYKAGKVPDVDYASLKSSLQDEAATILAEIDRLEKLRATKRKKIPKSPTVIPESKILQRTQDYAKSSAHVNKRDASILIALVVLSPLSPPPKLSPAR